MRRWNLNGNGANCVSVLRAWGTVVVVLAGLGGLRLPAALGAEATTAEQGELAQQIKSVSPEELDALKRGALKSIAPGTTQPAPETAAEPALIVEAPASQAARTPAPTTQPTAKAPSTQPALAAKAPPAPERVFNFNWKDRAWSDALEDFSRESGLPVIGDEPPKTMVTFINAEPMTYREALRTMNDLLFQQGYHMERFENYLLLKRLPEWIRLVRKSYDSEEEFRSGQPEDDEFVRVLYTPSLGVAGELIERARGVVPDYCMIGTVEGTNIMSITCMAGDARKFLDYVHKFERQLPDPREQKIFKLKHAQAAEVLTIIQQLVDFSGAVPGPVDPRQRRPGVVVPAITGMISAAVEQNNNWLIIKAPPDKMVEIERIVEQIDVEGAGGPSEPKVFKLAYASAQELAEVIRQIVSGPQSRPTRRGPQPGAPQAGPTIVPEARTNSLIVLADQDQIAQIAALVQQFDSPAGQEGFKRVVLEHARADQMVETLRALLAAQGPGGRGRPPAAGPQVVADPAANAVLVAGDPQDVSRVLDMITELDKESDVGAWEHLVQLDSAKPSVLAKVLTDIFAGPRPGARGQPPAVRFIGFDDSNVLVVSAPQSEWTRIEPLIKELDRRSQAIGPTVRTWTIQHGEAEEIAASINQVLAGGGRRPGQVLVIADARTNSLLAQCSQDDFEKIDALVQLFDTPGEQAQPRFIELQNADPRELAGVLQQMFVEPGQPPRAGGPTVRILPAGSGLVIKAPPGRYEQVADMISKLDQTGPVDLEFRTYSLKRGQAESVARTLQSMLQARAAPGGRGPRGGAAAVQVSADPRTNQVVVAGSKSLMSLADELVAKLDAEDVGEAQVLRIVELERADGNEVAKVVLQSLAGGVGGRAAQVGLSATAEASGKRIVLSGLADQVDRAEQLIKQLDAAAEPSQVELRSFDLQEAEAVEVAKMIQSLMASSFKQGKGGAAPMTVSADERTKTLFVSGGPRDLTQVEELLAKLDKPSPAGLPMEFITLKSRDVEGVAEKVQRMAESRWSKKEMPTVEADTYFGSLIVISTPEQFTEIEKMVERVDKPSPREIFPVSLTYVPRKVTPDELVDALKQYAEAYDYKIKVATTQKAPADQEDWRHFVEEVTPGQRRDAHPCVLSLGLAGVRAQVDALLAQTTQPAEPTSQPATDAAPIEVSITVDEAGRLILRGPQDVLDNLESVIELIEASAPEKPEEERELHIYRLKCISATVAAQMIDRLFNEPVRVVAQPQQPQQPQQRQPQTRRGERGERGGEEQAEGEKQPSRPQPQAQPQQQPQQQPGAARQRVVVLPDVRNNWLIVRALSEDMDPVLKLLATIDVPQEIRYGIKIIRLKTLDAAAVEQALKAVLRLDTPRAGLRRPVPGDQQQIIQQLQEQLLQLEQTAGVTEATIGSADLITITSDPTINALIVSAPESAMELITGFIEQLEKEAPSDISEVRKIVLVHARVEDVVPQLETIFAEARRGRGAGPRTAGAAVEPSPLELGPVVFAGDTRTNSVIARGAPTDLDAVKKLLEQLDQEGEATQMELFPLASADATSMAAALQETYVGRGRGAARSDVRIAADPGTNTVLVWAPKVLREQIGRDIQMMDERSRQRVVQLIPVKNADAADVAQSLIGVYIPQGGRGRRAQTGLQIQHLSGTDKILISGTPAEVEEIEQVVRTLDEPGAIGQRDVRVIRLSHLAPTEAQQIITDYLRKGARGEELAGNVRITPSQAMGAVIVSGGSTQLDQIAAFLEKLDQPAEEGGTAPRIIALRNARASQLAETLTRIFTDPAQRGAGRRGAEELVPVIVPDELTNTLVVRAGASDFSQIEKMAQQIDAQQAGHEPGGVKVVQVAEGIDIRDLAQQIERTINTGEYYRANKTKSVPALVSIGIDERASALIVSGSPEKFVEVEQLVRKLEELKPTGPVRLRIINLQNMDATSVQRVLDQIMQRQTQPRSSTPQPRVPAYPGGPTRGQRGELPEHMRRFGTPVLAMRDDAMLAHWLILTMLTQAPSERPEVPATQPTTAPEEQDQVRGQVNYSALDERTLILQGDDHDLAILEAIVAELDRAAPRQELKVFTLENAQAADIAPRLQIMYQQIVSALGPRARPEDRITIIPEPSSNSLIVSALPERMDEISQLVQTLDAKPVLGKVTYRTFALRHIQAAEAKTALDSLLQKLRAKRGATVQQITIEADERTNSLIVTAAEQDFAQIEQFIKTIDVEPAFATAEMLVIGLINADADALAKVINEMLTAGPAAGRQGARTLAEQIRRLRLRAREGEQLKELPELDLEKPIKVIPEPGTNSLIVSSHADNLKAMEQVVALLDRVPVWHDVKIRVFMLEHADAAELAKMLEGIFKQGQGLPSRPGGQARKDGAVPKSVVGEALVYNVGIAADPRTNALLVSGREESLALAETLVAKLDQPGMGLTFPIQLFKLEHADAQRIADVIQKVMDQRLDALKKVGQATLERERVFVAADVRSNMLIISAKPDNYEEIVALARKLDSAPEALIDQIQIINLEKTQANVLKPKIEALWQRRAALRRAGAGLPEDQPVVEADERSNSLLIAANPEDFQMIRRLVAQLEAQPFSPIADIRLIPLEHNDASVIAPMVKRLFDERTKMRLTPGQQPLPSDQVAVEFDQATNSLIVAASNENYESVLELIRKVDVELPTGGVVQFFHLKWADANRISEVITNLFKDGLWKPGSLGVETPVSEARNKVTLQVDERSNTIIVSASKENFAIIRTLIEQMDSEEDFLVGNLQLFPLQYADAVKMASLLADLFDKMRSAKQSVQQTVELPMTIIPEQSTNTLIIAGSRDGLTRAASLIEKFDRRAGPPTSEFRVYQLHDADAVRVAPVIDRLFKDRAPKDQQSTPLLVEADAGSNSLVVSASRDDHDLVDSLVAMLDKPATTAEQLRIFPLRKAKAEDLRKILEDLYGKRKGQNQEQTLTFGADARTNSLIVCGGPGDVEDVKKVIERLDTTEPVEEQTVRIFKLKQADAEATAEMLGQVMQGKATGGAAGAAGTETQSVLISFVDVDATGQQQVRKLLRERIQIIPDIRTNSLIVTAPPDSMDMLDHLIKTLDGLEPELAEVRVFHLYNADASETVKTLESLFQIGAEAPRGGQQGQEERRLVLGSPAAGLLGAEGATVGGRALLAFTEDTRTNSVIAVGTSEYLRLVEQLITRLDSEAVEERVTKVVNLKNSKADSVRSAVRDFVDSEVKRLSELGEESALRKVEREVSVVAYEDTNQLVLSVSPRYESQVTNMINELDQAPPQVMIQALLAEVTLNNRLEMGLEFALQDLLFSSTARVGRNNMLESNNFDVVVGTDVGAAGSGLGGFSFTINGEDFNFLLRALQSESHLEILSSPRILVMDNQTANFNVGQDVPFVRGVSFLETGQTRTQIEYENVGIKLNVTPRINPDGFVIMVVKPEISSITSSSVPISEGVQAPIFNTRNAETTIAVKDGETAVIGGLITTTDDVAENKIPILGDMPGVGVLFRATTHQNSKTELLIILTPRVIRAAEDLRSLSVTERDKLDLLPENIRTSPLMEQLRVSRTEPVPAPGQVPTAPPPAPPAGVRYQLPEPQRYGPPKSLLLGAAGPVPELHAVVFEPAAGSDEFADDYEYYLRQRH